jgi:putative endonuclease
MVQSASRRALYIGMTSKLIQRVFQHKTHEFEGFTGSYNAVRLVYWESFDDVHKSDLSREATEELAQREEAVANRKDKSKVQRSSY